MSLQGAAAFFCCEMSVAAWVLVPPEGATHKLFYAGIISPDSRIKFILDRKCTRDQSESGWSGPQAYA